MLSTVLCTTLLWKLFLNLINTLKTMKIPSSFKFISKYKKSPIIHFTVIYVWLLLSMSQQPNDG